MTAPDPKSLLPEIVSLSRQAGDTVMQVYGGNFAVRAKADASPVTVADERSEQLILRRLSELTPDIPAASEEAISQAGVGDWHAQPLFWLVDPLDGTREFASRNGEFSINIALVSDRRPILGVVHAPAVGLTWWGAAPGTAMMQRRDEPAIAIHARRPPPAGMVALESRSHGDRAALDAFLGEHKIAARRQSGSALKFGLLAQGEADIYPRFGPTMEWDTAAGHAVLNAAGGHIETLAGAPLLYGKPGLRNPDFVAWGAA
ncbi:MAG TPA: 3'(2'),5'-bisphosphate nucleotidase CysQ [Alphaproteobacteria bacterium]